MMKTSINSFKVAHFVISGWYCAVLLAETQLAQFSLYVHKGGLKPDSFHFFFLLAETPNVTATCTQMHQIYGK